MVNSREAGGGAPETNRMSRAWNDLLVASSLPATTTRRDSASMDFT